MLSIKDAVITGRRAINAQKDWGFDRTQYLNASEAGDCIRKIWFSKHAAESASAQPFGYAERGNTAERYVIESLQALNQYEVARALDDQASVQHSQLKLSATPDGVLRDNATGETLGLEIKSIDPRTNRKNLPRENHVLQLRIAMALLNERENLGIKRGLLIYIDASNYDDIIQFELDADDGVIAVADKTAQKVFRTKNVDTLDREGKRDGGKDCRYCPYTAICGVQVEELANVRVRANRSSNFDAAAKRYVEIKDEEEALEIEKKGLAEDIKAGLASRKTSKAVVGDIEVTLSSVSGRTTLDRKAVEKAGIDLTPYEKVGAASARLLVQRM